MTRWPGQLIASVLVWVALPGGGVAAAGDPPQFGLLPAPAGITTELVLRGPRTIVAGSTRRGVLVVRNRTGASIDLRDLAPGHCTPKFQVR